MKGPKLYLTLLIADPMIVIFSIKPIFGVEVGDYGC